MASPLPGMDPYLESDALWADFQKQIVAALYQVLVPGLVDRYRARVGARRYLTELVLFTSIVHEEQVEQFVEVRTRVDGKLVTLIEVVSPKDKATDQGRAAYLETRRDALRQGAGVVEIDLTLQGRPMLEYDRSGLPEWHYAVTVTRSSQPDRHEIYTSTLQKSLPRFRLPLAPDHRDVLVDLQAAFARAYDQGDFASRIVYSTEPEATLPETARAWMHDLLKRQGLR